MSAAAIVLAAGAGRRMGEDKALLQLGERTAIEHVVDACRAGGATQVVIVRTTGATALPSIANCEVVEIAERADMMASVRAGLEAVAAGADLVLFPVDHPLVPASVVRSLLAQLARGVARIVLPLWHERPGHPIAIAGGLRAELGDERTRTLRDVVARDPERVGVVRVDTPWVGRDLDTPDDLAAARAWLAGDRA